MGRKRVGIVARDVERWIKQGFGSGEGQSYKPWIRVADVPSQGRSRRIKGLKSGRVHHLLSDLEYAIFLMAEYSQHIVDIREQYPLLPYGRTEVIATSMGVRHPAYPQSNTPIVMTHDFVLTMGPLAVDQQTVAISAKYESATKERAKRTLEKLEIERRFACDVGNAKWACVTEKDFDPQIVTNLDWLHYGMKSSLPPAYADVASGILPVLRTLDYERRPLSSVAKDLGSLTAFRGMDPLLAFKVAAWKGHLPLDLTAPLGPRHPVTEQVARPAAEALHAA